MKTLAQLILEVHTRQTYGDEKSLYSVDGIIRRSQIKRANTRKVSDLVSLNSDLTNDEGHFGKLLKNPTPEFMARVKRANTQFPIHIDAKGNIIDGSHRLAALHFTGQKHAKVHVVGSRTLDKTKIDEAAKTTGEYRKDALEREAEFRRSVAPRQKKLQGKPLQNRKRTLAQMAAGVEARTKMQDHYKAITPMHWKPPGMEDSAGGYTNIAHDPWLRATPGSSKPTDLFFSHGGDHLAIHSTVNAGHPTGDRLHADLPDYHRAEGQDPVNQGRIRHDGVDKDGKRKGVITHLSLQSRASGFGERFIKAQKRRTANKLSRMYPGYTHHDADDNMKEF